tara:strand:+ start:7658 stop:8182 length:525 start_codon:yes stop_codon:yes gene_type:complete
MTKKILSFEEYATSKNFTSADEVTETDDDKVLGISDEDSESEEHEKIEGEEEEKEEDAEDESDGDESEEEEGDESEEEEIIEKQVAELIKECYESAVKEAIAYDGDDYPDHTLESYLKENAALIAAFATKTLESAHAELRDDELTIETYEAVLNSMKDAYSKKIDEMKEVWASK